MGAVGLGLYPHKTRIVYCQDGRRRAEHEHTSFAFPRVCLPGPGARGRNGRNLTGFLPANRPRGAQGQGRRAAPDADRPAQRPVAGRPGALAERPRRRVDQLLRPVLPDALDPLLKARQRLSEALGREEVQAAADRQALPRPVDRAAHKPSPAYSPTGARSARTSADQNSPVTGDRHAAIRGSRRLQRPGHPTPSIGRVSRSTIETLTPTRKRLRAPVRRRARPTRTQTAVARSSVRLTAARSSSRIQAPSAVAGRQGWALSTGLSRTR